MSMEPMAGQTPVDPDTDHQQDAMKDQLRKDVASWREGRADGRSDGRSGSEGLAVARPAERPKRAKAAAPVVPAAAAGEAKKPFGMSYGGSTTADYIRERAARGAR
jgi:hypothetical protein